jgi:hypothetical protein
VKHLLFALAPGLFALAASASAAQPDTPQAWLDYMGDFRQNSLPMQDPQAFLSLMNAASEPEFHQRRFSLISEPAYWARTTSTAATPEMMQNFARVMSPEVAARWMQAMMDPRFYQVMMTQFSDPQKWMRWSQATTQPASYAPFFKPMDPAYYQRWQQSLQQGGSNTPYGYYAYPFPTPGNMPAAAGK